MNANKQMIEKKTHMEWLKLQKKIKNLPIELLEIVRIYAWEDTFKVELIDKHEKKQTKIAWDEVSREWINYCEDIEDWSMIWGNAYSIRGSGILAVYCDQRDVRMSNQENWYRIYPLRHAKGREEKKVVLTPEPEWDEMFIEILQAI